jgi:hypothetical protein
MKELITNIDFAIKELRKIKPNKMVQAIFKENESQLIDTNFEEQLYLKGQLADGSSLPSYSPTTVFLKQSGDGDRRTENMTLKDQGDFYKGANVKYTKDGYLFGSTDEKADELKFNYGEIFGLTDDNLQEHIDKLFYPELKKRVYDFIIKALIKIA